jgi:excisionase family DNA binding protein
VSQGAGVQGSQPLAGKTKDFVTRLLPDSRAPTIPDLWALDGGRDRLMTVKQVAAHLNVGAWAVYRLCESGELPHVRIVNSIRVRPADLRTFVDGRRRLASGARRER